MSSNICICFAGAVGSSKTPTAVYLSYKLGLPIFSTDAIRVELLEDDATDTLDKDKYTKLRNARLNDLLQTGQSFILDASIDRNYKWYFDAFKKYCYSHFVISFDLSKSKLVELYEAKHYFASKPNLPRLIHDHNLFLQEYTGPALHITDKTFHNRLTLSFDAVLHFMH